MVTMKRNKCVETSSAVGSRKPSPVIGSVGDSWITLGLGTAEREWVPEKRERWR